MALLEKEMFSTGCQLVASAVNNPYISRDNAEGDVHKSSTASPSHKRKKSGGANFNNVVQEGPICTQEIAW